MKVIKDKTSEEQIAVCPDCGSIFYYNFKEVEWYCLVPTLRCPCCKFLNHLDMYKK